MSKIVDLDAIDDRLAAGVTFRDMQALKEKAKSIIAADLTRSRQKGYVEGLEAAKEQFIMALDRALREFRQHLHMQEKAMVDAVIGAVRAIIDHIPDEERVSKLVRRALSDIAAAETVKLNVPPEDAEGVRAVVKTLGEAIGDHTMTVVVNSLLSPGEMFLETSLGRIHIGLDRQITRLENALRRGVARSS
jgi:type III secretion protein L